MEKPKQTVSINDIKRKIDEVVEETKEDLTQPAGKVAAKSALAVFAITALSYWAGKRRGKRFVS